MSKRLVVFLKQHKISRHLYILMALTHELISYRENLFPYCWCHKSAGFLYVKEISWCSIWQTSQQTLAEIQVTTINAADTITKLMNQGLKATKKSKDEPQFVSFSVLAKHGSKETAADNHLDMYISVYTVRSLNGV